MTPDFFFKFQIRILKVICCRSNREIVGLEITGPYLLKIQSYLSELFYGITIAAYSISSGVFGLVAGRWLDKTRSVKMYTNIILVMQIIGTLFYLVPHHVAFQVIIQLHSQDVYIDTI